MNTHANNSAEKPIILLNFSSVYYSRYTKVSNAFAEKIELECQTISWFTDYIL